MSCNRDGAFSFGVTLCSLCSLALSLSDSLTLALTLSINLSITFTPTSYICDLADSVEVSPVPH
ncbi:uncharacterized protein BO88DRAFT_404127 [Aspergillus vadensis CBS 113365]|uniref:Uncharacterized protein n=1 Tax=Aspergillus vadensis (strain CBS 113365 / IMI 142717 / IBT 24658) TaxID=1448311 RepID=A0A319BV89_ASPVC|nr:hypothetical protein BO88DRAFT_404127 [Aspergillus vadensis CBS 113365]PYH69753.1 hypothetical protein BO88DRAFT_404127 [Aspergillus vadensis CBS 113365]